jgi:hypothetical protein
MLALSTRTCRSCSTQTVSADGSLHIAFFRFAVLARQAADLARRLYPGESYIGSGETGKSTDAKDCRLHLRLSSRRLRVSYGTS